ncbi:hypothetical protein ABEB36_009436 [Hypothenemus hampei]|uniref:HTH CENPB-type domain-containing protein n=1 Tax=Hypothenemus hampei TaxID=57062 RepID=A0ABD1EKG3_HYPHA
MSNIENTTGPSNVEEVPENSLNSEKSKLLLKDALVYYEHLLMENNLISVQSSSSISHEAMLIGQQLFENTLILLNENQFVIDDELLHEDEIGEETDFDITENNESSDEYEPEGKKSKLTEHIPLDYKIKAVNIAKAHPTWKLQTLQKNGCRRLTKKEQLVQWEKDVMNGGNTFDKYRIIDSWVYDRFVESRQDCQQVTTRNLQQWALTAAGQFKNFNFKASTRWVAKFKNIDKIRQRKITKFISKKESSIEELLVTARTFCLETSHLIPNFQEKYVINTDQTGCQYESTYNRTLAPKGSKAVFVKKIDLNKVSHSYTA